MDQPFRGRRLALLCISLLLFIWLPLIPGASARSSAQADLQVAQVFWTYYDSHNGPFVLGKPLTALTQAGGYPAQYFEMGRLEDHRKDTGDPTWAFTYGSLVSEMTGCDPYGQVANLTWRYGEPASRNYFVNTLQLAHAPAKRQAPPTGFLGGTATVPDGVFVPFDAALRPAPGYVVPRYFWDYVNRVDLFPGGWLHDIGLPVTGLENDVLYPEPSTGRYIPIKAQAFERAVLVYDAANTVGMQVWRANIGADAVRRLPQSRTPGIEVPSRGARLTFPLHILARVGSPCQQVKAAVVWQDGTKVVQTFTLHGGEDGRGLLIDSIDWPNRSNQPFPRTQGATLDITGLDGKSLGRQSITIVSPDDLDTREVSLYFYGQDRNVISGPVAVTRRIPRTARIATATLEELLWGPRPYEQGLLSSIPDPLEILSKRDQSPEWGPRVKLLGLEIKNGIATPNFSREINAYGGGSSRVAGISGQINWTLMQFPTVHGVQIAVEGNTEAVLQP